MARTFTMTIEGQEYDADDLELDEMIEVQDLCGGVAFSELNYGDAKVLKALAFVMRKHDHPDVTMEEIGKIKMLTLLAGDEEMPPLPPAEGEASQNGSEMPAGSGHPASADSTPGSPLSTSAS